MRSNVCNRIIQVPKRFEGMSWDQVHSSVAEKARSVVQSTLTDEPKTALLHGAVGVGKTALLYLMREMLVNLFLNRHMQGVILGSDQNDYGEISYGRDRRGRRDEIIAHYSHSVCGWFRSDVGARVLTELDLVGTLRTHVDADDKWPNGLRDTLIILDDWGRGYNHDWNRTLLDEWIDWRWSNKLSLWISTNYSLDEMRAQTENARMIDRLLDKSWCMDISLGNKSRRTLKDS